jgi:hypothetical protein
VKGKEFSNATIEEINQALKKVVGDMETDVQVVDSISRSGRVSASYAKYKQFIGLE